MTKAELRLELIRIVHHNGRVASASLQMVYEYEKAFAGMTEEETAPASADGANKSSKRPAA